ncbi:MAG: extracellular solute-binding protein [Alphaproteobacteria bacterium]|nr:extracellular solute-binding protein [Alphaproteobacteria bacterium]
MRILKTNCIAVAALALAVAAPATAQTREVVIGTPGFTNIGGLEIISKGFEAETGIKVTLRNGGMDDVVKMALDGSVDAVFLPADLMDEATAKGAITTGTRKHIGRSYQGLAVMKGAKVPDISTKEKFIAALKSANKVLHSRCNGTPGGPGCTRTAYMLSSLFDLPEMAGVKHAPSPYGEGGDALARGEGDMAVQNISQILKWDNLVVAGPIPEEYGRYLDAVAAVPSKAAHQDLGKQFIAYATQPGTFSIWYSRGVDPRKGAQ